MSKLGLLLGLPGYGGGGAPTPEADVIRVRRTSDSTESDFNLTEWDDGTLDTFVGAGDGCLATWKDSSGNGNDVTQSTTTLQPKVAISGTVQEGVVFDGSNDYLATSGNSGISGDAQFTFAAWVKVSTLLGDYKAVCSIGSEAAPGFSANLVIMTSGAFGLSTGGGRNAHSAAGAVTAGVWTHLAVTKTSGPLNTTTKLYKNGVEVALSSPGTTTPNITNRPFSVGRFADNTYSYGIFPGAIDHVKIYNSALTAGNIATLAAGGEVGSPLIFLKGNYAP